MKRVRSVMGATVLAWCLVIPLAGAQAPHYLSSGAVDLLVLLAPPPGPEDPRTTAELDELRRIQATRSPERVALAQADVAETVFRLLTIFGRPFTPAQLPTVAAFFRNLTDDGAFATGPAKRAFGRPRPYVLARDLAPVCPLATNRAYPSGHTTVGYFMGVVLAAMVPEERARIFARTQEFAESRLVCGVHYRSDIEAGRIAGTVLAAAAMRHPDFQRDFTAARSELRAALGL
jgi:acid phosphatase (class A)